MSAGAVAASVNDFAATNGFGTAAASRCFATTSGLDDFAAAVTAAVVTGEQFLQQTEFRSAAAAVTARVGDFATTSRSGNKLLATAGGFDVATAIAAVATQFIEQASVGVGRAKCNEGDCQQSRNDYTTHRDISMDLGFGKVLPRVSRNTSERPDWPFSKQCPKSIVKRIPLITRVRP
jgi:hypothetical protein